jgi:hypothetical protein
VNKIFLKCASAVVRMLKNQLKFNVLRSQLPIHSVTLSIYALKNRQTVLRNTNITLAHISMSWWCQESVGLPVWTAGNSNFRTKRCIDLNSGTLKRRNQIFGVPIWRAAHLFFGMANFQWSIAQQLECCCVKTLGVCIQIMPKVHGDVYMSFSTYKMMLLENGYEKEQ